MLSIFKKIKSKEHSLYFLTKFTRMPSYRLKTSWGWIFWKNITTNCSLFWTDFRWKLAKHVKLNIHGMPYRIFKYISVNKLSIFLLTFMPCIKGRFVSRKRNKPLRYSFRDAVYTVQYRRFAFIFGLCR